MAGQRYASLKILVGNHLINGTVTIWLNGANRTLSNFLPNNSKGPNNALAIATAVRNRLIADGQANTYSVEVLAPRSENEGVVLITATSYDTAQNFAQLPSSNVAGLISTQARFDGIKPVIINFTRVDARCFGSATGSIVLDVSNGTPQPSPGYSYLWADGIQNRDRFNLPASTHTVTVTDESSGTDTDVNTGVVTPAPKASETVTIEVFQNPLLVVAINRSGNDIEATATGGLAPYTYLWTDGVTTAARPNAQPGVTYVVTVTDAAGCSKQGSLRFELVRYWFSGNPITLALDAGDAYRTDPVTKPGLRFACEVFVEQQYLSDEFVQVGQVLEQPADAQGRTVFEVQELLEPYVQSFLPPLAQRGFIPATGLFRRFYLRHYEITTEGPSAAVALNDNYLVRGGLNKAEAATGTWFGGYQDTRLPFLTWEPRRKKVLPDQPEYLFFMKTGAGLPFLFFGVRVYYADGTNQVLTQAAQPVTRRYEVYCLAAGYDQLLLHRVDTPARPVVRWEAYVLDASGTPVSEVRTFELDRRPAPTRRYFLYVNSLGGLNTLCARGRSQQQLTTVTQSGNQALSAGYSPLDGDVRIDRKTGRPTLKVYTGARSRDQVLADQDFLLSERVLLVENGEYRAGTVKDATFTPADEDETRHVLAFDFELPTERFHTPRLR